MMAAPYADFMDQKCRQRKPSLREQL
jgi:hypothetical protein